MPLSTTSELIVTSPSCTPENLIKAKQRLETIQMMMKKRDLKQAGEPRMRLQDQLATIFEEIIFSQSNNYDSQSLRLLMDFQWQNVNAETMKL